MNCERARELFSEYLEGTDQGLNSALREHIDGCSSCRREYDQFMQTWLMLDSLPEAPVPSGFRHDVIMRMARIQHEQRKAMAQRTPSIHWSAVLQRLLPVRAVAVAGAAVALALLMLKVPVFYEFVNSGSSQEAVVSSMGQPAAQAGVIEASPLDSGRKRVWVSRQIDRNTVWVTIRPYESPDGTTVYQVHLAINQAALKEGEITARIGASVYLLPSNEFALDYEDPARPVWEGSILKDSPVIVPVVVDQSRDRSGSVNLLVTWKFRSRQFAYLIFIPTQKPGTSGSTFDLSVDRAGSFAVSPGADNLYSALQKVTRDYGIPIVVNAKLTEKPSVVDLGSRSLEDTLRSMLEPAKLDWLEADDAIYVDREWDIEPGSE